VRFPGGIQVTEKGRIAILDQGTDSGTTTIYTYNPPHGRSLGKPLTSTPLSPANAALAFAFQGPHDRFVLTTHTFLTVGKPQRAKPDNGEVLGDAQLFGFPAAAGPVQSVRLPNFDVVLNGVAVSPSDQP
jgi:hypothetical protein